MLSLVRINQNKRWKENKRVSASLGFLIIPIQHLVEQMLTKCVVEPFAVNT